MIVLTLLVLTVAVCAQPVPGSRGPDYWRDKAIYQVFTDRFAKGGGDTTPCHNFARFCGGNHQGVRSFINYIKGMGFDAVWISPISSQTSGADWLNMDGYHGYWPLNIYELNENFGNERDMKELVDALHAAGISVMLDTVPNHIGYVQPHETVPFDKDEYFHGCKPCTVGCGIDWLNEGSVTECRLKNLKDLDHSNEFVTDELLAWHQQVATKYNLDGFRIDAAQHVDAAFLQALNKNSTLFTMGEFANTKVSYISGRLGSGALSTSLNFPLQAVLSAVFIKGGDMSALSEMVALLSQMLPQHMDVLGNFADCHDTERFLCERPDTPLFKNALAAVFFLPGIPILYYGSEQAMIGSRDPLWNFDYATDSELYIFIKTLNYYRRNYTVWDQPVQEVASLGGQWTRDDVYGFTRGEVLVILTNAQDVKGWAPRRTTVVLPEQLFNRTLTNILDPKDKVTVGANGTAVIRMRWNRHPQIYVPVALNPTSFGVVHAPAVVRTVLHLPASRILFGISWGLAVLFAVLLKVTLDSGWDTLYRWWQLQRNDRVQLTASNTPPDAPVPPQSINPFLTLATVRRSHDLTSPAPSTGAAPTCTSPHVRQSETPALQKASRRPALLDVRRLSATFGHGAGSPVTYLAQSPLPSRRELLANASARHQPGGEPPSGGPSNNKLRYSSAGVELLGKALTAPARPSLLNHAILTARVDAQEKAAQQLMAAFSLDKHAPATSASKSPPMGGRVEVCVVAGGKVEAQVVQGPPSLPSHMVSNPSFSPDPLLTHPLEEQLSLSSLAAVAHHAAPAAGGNGTHQDATSTAASAAQPHRVTSDDSIELPLLPAHRRKPSDPWSKPGDAFSGFRRKTANELQVPSTPALLAQLGDAVTSVAVTGGQAHHVRKLSDPFTSWFSNLLPGNLASLLKRQHDNGYTQAVAAARQWLLGEQVFHVAMEYTVPHLGWDTQFVYGGLGKVVEIFLRCWPGPMSLICPLYADAYVNADAHQPMFASEAGPDLSFTVVVNRQLVGMDVYKMEVPLTSIEGKPHPYAGARTFYFVQSDIFRSRVRSSIYSFGDEEEMLAWLSVFSQATSVIAATYGVTRIQFHDYHGGLALLYMPPSCKLEVLYVAHNAHYNGVFPISTKARREYLYSMFDLDAARMAPYTEHRGAFDILHAILLYIKDRQKGFGCVAVSPRYAAQICTKISVFWMMDPQRICGITNALLLGDSLASRVEREGLTVADTLAIKAAAKAQLQRTFGLTQDGSCQVVAFLGRMTHQKGCDVIGMAADSFMAACPNAQLVVVGPLGDAKGSLGSSLLERAAAKFPGRVFAPRGRYCSGAEKEMLLHASDWVLVPSRFEPCGLVDVEFGWHGACCIGHDTGGLGKMPGVYYAVESSADTHLAVKLSRAVVDALGMPDTQRHGMMWEALGRRFPTADMMDAYAEQWARVMGACALHRQEQQAAPTTATKTKHDEFYDSYWRKRNVPDPDGLLLPSEAGPVDGQISVWGRTAVSLRELLGTPRKKHAVSNVLLLLLQPWSQLPGILVCSYVMYVTLGYRTVTSCQLLWDKSVTLFPPELNTLSVRVLMYFATYAVTAPLWTLWVMSCRPALYVRVCAVATLLAMLIVHAAFLFTEILNIAVILAGAIAPCGIPLIALGFLGEEQEVSEMGLPYLITVEVTSVAMLFTGMMLALFAHSPVPFLAVGGVALVVTACVVVWVLDTDTLSPAYFHMKLVLLKQWRLLAGLRSFWLTSAVSILEHVGQVLLAYITLVKWDLKPFVQMLTIDFGVKLVCLVSLFGFLKLRCAQLRIQTLVVVLATLPGFALVRGVVTGYSHALPLVFGIIATTQVVFGARSHLVGLLAFQTLPSRELVAVWQLLTVVMGSIVALTVVIAGYSVAVPIPTLDSLVVGCGVVEGCRLLGMLLLSRFHHAENLSTL